MADEEIVAGVAIQNVGTAAAPYGVVVRGAAQEAGRGGADKLRQRENGAFVNKAKFVEMPGAGTQNRGAAGALPETVGANIYLETGLPFIGRTQPGHTDIVGRDANAELDAVGAFVVDDALVAAIAIDDVGVIAAAPGEFVIGDVAFESVILPATANLPAALAPVSRFVHRRVELVEAVETDAAGELELLDHAGKAIADGDIVGVVAAVTTVGAGIGSRGGDRVGSGVEGAAGCIEHQILDSAGVLALAQADAFERHREAQRIRAADAADDVAAIPRIDDIDVVAGAAVELVVAGAANKGIVAAIALETIAVIAALQHVVVGAAKKHIDAAAAVESIVAGFAVQGLGIVGDAALFSVQAVVAVATVEQVYVIPTVEEIGAGAAEQVVAPIVAIQAVVTVAADHLVVAAACFEDVLAVAAKEAVVTGVAEERVLAFVATQEIAVVSAVQGVVTGFTVKRIDATAAFGIVVAAAGEENVVAQAADQDIVAALPKKGVVASFTVQGVALLQGEWDIAAVAIERIVAVAPKKRVGATAADE